MAALVVTLGVGASAARAERTYSAGEVRQIMEIIETHAAGKRAREQKKKDDAARKQRVRAAKWRAALRMGAEIKAERARRDQETADAKEAHQVRRARLLHLLLGGRSGSGAVPRRAR